MYRSCAVCRLCRSLTACVLCRAVLLCCRAVPQGVIHRDIKGANILSTKEGVVKLADFGVATRLNENKRSDSVVGTPYWSACRALPQPLACAPRVAPHRRPLSRCTLWHARTRLTPPCHAVCARAVAPEIIEMTGQQSAACDIWSVGCTVVELITGKPPYFDLDQMPALFRIVQDDHPPLPEGISGVRAPPPLRPRPALQSLLFQLLRVSDRIRFSDATAVAACLAVPHALQRTAAPTARHASRMLTHAYSLHTPPPLGSLWSNSCTAASPRTR